MKVWKKISTGREYHKALKRIDALIDDPRTEAEQNEITLLSFLVEAYEAVYVQIADASPDEVIRFAMEMRGIRQVDLVPILGSKGYVSRIVNGVSPVLPDALYPLSAVLGIPVESLIPKTSTLKILEPGRSARKASASR